MEMTPKKFKIISKIVVCLLAALIIIFAVFSMIPSVSFTNIIWSIWQIIFSCILVASEFKLKLIDTYFGMLSNYFGKGIFLIFLGTLMINGLTIKTFIGIVVIILGVFALVFYKKFQELSTEPQSVEQLQQYDQPQIHV